MNRLPNSSRRAREDHAVWSDASCQRAFWNWLTAVVIPVTWALAATSARAEPYPDRFVWIFGWSLRNESDVAEISLTSTITVLAIRSLWSRGTWKKGDMKCHKLVVERVWSLQW